MTVVSKAMNPDTAFVKWLNGRRTYIGLHRFVDTSCYWCGEETQFLHVDMFRVDAPGPLYVMTCRRCLGSNSSGWKEFFSSKMEPGLREWRRSGVVPDFVRAGQRFPNQE